MSKDNKTQDGFTLIELLVASGIVAVIMTLVIVNFRTFERTTILENEAEKLSSVLRQAQVWALTGQLRDGTRPSGGFGVHINSCATPPCYYSLFADADGDHNYDVGESIASDQFQFSSYVGATVEIDGSSKSLIDIVFEPPLSVIYFNGQLSGEVATIKLEHGLSDGEKEVDVNRLSGQVNIQ